MVMTADSNNDKGNSAAFVTKLGVGKNYSKLDLSIYDSIQKQRIFVQLCTFLKNEDEFLDPNSGNSAASGLKFGKIILVKFTTKSILIICCPTHQNLIDYFLFEGVPRFYENLSTTFVHVVVAKHFAVTVDANENDDYKSNSFREQANE